METLQHIPVPFLSRASEVLGSAVSGNIIVQVTVAYAAEYGLDLPHPTYPFQAPNKRTALLENLRALPASVQYQVIAELCDRASQTAQVPAVAEVKLMLVSRYSHLSPDTGNAWSGPLTVEARHWLDEHPNVKKLYVEALQKHNAGVYLRNALDDLRLALELLLQEILGNERSLENQVPALGHFVKSKGGSKELSNMLEKLIDYYTKYQNTYVKHDDAVPNEEVELVLELTSSFMKHFARMHARS
ncbi:MAG: hypothetical protein OJF60_003068 [Burkholderiaceae bacterium]|nr:MAG: hypothetical protein OJF60_003068 [Burkholderiaceae bacterium]